MTSIIRLTCSVVILIVVGGTAAVLQPEWASDLGLPDWTVDHWTVDDWTVDDWTVEKTRLEQQRADALVEANRVRMRQLPCRRRAVQGVIDGRLTIFEAAAVFHHLNQEYGALAFGPTFPGCSSDEEWSCRQLIKWVQCYAPKGSECLVPFLEEELRQHIEKYGAVILPEANETFRPSS